MMLIHNRRYMMKLKVKGGFTLSEMLLAMAIVGVVAAITIPQLAAGMYDKGVDAIFAAAGGTGVGVINEARTRRLSGEDVWAIGVDVDQYTVGDMGNGESCILTSAMKYIDQTTYDLVYAAYNNEFPGGENQTLGAATASVGIPKTNPNLSEETMAVVAEVEQMIINGDITVQGTSDGLIP